MKVDRRDGRDPQNREKFFLLGVGRSCGRKRCVREINVSHAGDPVHVEIRLLCGRLPRKGGGLTGMVLLHLFLF